MTVFFIYFSYNAYVVWTDDDPPVSVTTEGWTGLGKWALCPGKDHHLHSAGFGICAAEPAGMHYSPDWRKQDAVRWQLPLQSVNWTNNALWWTPKGPHTCAIVDLSNVTLQSVPAAFNLCGSGVVMVHSNNRWMAVTTLYSTSQFSVVKVSKRRHGWSYGYSSSLTDIFSTTTPQVLPVSSMGASISKMCHMTTFLDGRHHVYAATITVEDPVVVVTSQLGALPRLVRLMSGTGGFLTVLSLIFTTVFVKKYPDAEVVVMYEARTLIGHRGKDEALPRPGSDCKEATKTAPTENARLQQRRPSGVPPRPHPPGGERRFSGTSAVV